MGRIVTGIGNGINSSNVPSYQMEMTRPKRRGALLCAQGTIMIFGLVIAYWLDYGLSFVASPAQWRFHIAFQAFFAVCLVIQMIPLPESPRWLLEHGHKTRASSILAPLDYDYATEDSEEVVLLRRQIEIAHQLEHADGPLFVQRAVYHGQDTGRPSHGSLCNGQYPAAIHLSLCKILLLVWPHNLAVAPT